LPPHRWLQLDGFRVFLIRLLDISFSAVNLREPEDRFLILSIFPQRGVVFCSASFFIVSSVEVWSSSANSK